MERPIFQPVGTAQEELDTPALVVDLDVMERNIVTLHDAFRESGYGDEPAGAAAKVRPHVSCHGCPEIARRQLAIDDSAIFAPVSNTGGIAVNTLGEAKAFAASGIREILITGRVVTRSKIRRLCSLSLDTDVVISVAVDSPGNVADLAEAATSAGTRLGVVVDIDAGYGYGGVAPGPEAVELAKVILDSLDLMFFGIMAYEGPLPVTDQSDREAETRRRLQPVLNTRELLEREGLEVSAVSVGSTHNYDVAARISGITEVLAGVYPLMDAETCRIRPELEPAARVLATVISHPVSGRAVVDAGHKTTGSDFGVPVLDGIDGATATRFSAEHGILELEGPAMERLLPNDKAWLVPYNLALCVNQFDYIRAVRAGKLVGYWPIAARGRLD